MPPVSITAEPIVETLSLLAGLPVGIIAAPIEERILLGAVTAPYVYVVDTGNNRVNAYDYDGNFKFSFGSYGTGNGQFNSPYGICNDGTNIWVTDRGNHRVQKFTLFGVYVSQFGSLGTGDGQFNEPMGVAVDDRFVWVVDHGNNRFQVFDKSGQPVYKLGEYGSGDDQFNGPTDCSVDDYYFYIRDEGNSRTVRYTKNLELGSYGAGILPAFTISATGARRSGFGDGILPAFSLAGGATGMEGHVGSGACVLPALTLSATGKGITHGDGLGILPALTLDAHGIGGGIGGGAGILSALIVTATGHEDGFGDGACILPAFTLVAFGYMTPATTTYSGIVLNLKTKGISEYTNFAFNSLAIIGGKLHGANASGIFPLEGSDDNGTVIDALFKTGTVDLHKDIVRKLREAYFSGRFAGDMRFTLEEAEDDQTVYNAEDMEVTADGNRIKFARGHKGRFVNITVANVDGADFDAMGLKVFAEPAQPIRAR